MDDMQFLGYLITALLTIGSFVTLIFKFIQPINELRVVIQKLNDNIDAVKEDNEYLDNKIDEHEHKIGDLDNRVGTLETKVKIYHGSESR